MGNKRKEGRKKLIVEAFCQYLIRPCVYLRVVYTNSRTNNILQLGFSYLVYPVGHSSSVGGRTCKYFRITHKNTNKILTDADYIYGIFKQSYLFFSLNLDFFLCAADLFHVCKQESARMCYKSNELF